MERTPPAEKCKGPRRKPGTPQSVSGPHRRGELSKTYFTSNFLVCLVALCSASATFKRGQAGPPADCGRQCLQNCPTEKTCLRCLRVSLVVLFIPIFCSQVKPFMLFFLVVSRIISYREKSTSERFSALDVVFEPSSS